MPEPEGWLMVKALVRNPVFPSDFRALFQTLARCAVAGSFGVAAGCASSVTPGDNDGASPEPDAAQPMLWTHLTCDEDGNWPLRDTTIDPPLDSLALDSTYLDPVAMTRSSSPYLVYGTECAGASDAAPCAIGRGLAAAPVAAMEILPSRLQARIDRLVLEEIQEDESSRVIHEAVFG